MRICKVSGVTKLTNQELQGSDCNVFRSSGVKLQFDPSGHHLRRPSPEFHRETDTELQTRHEGADLKLSTRGTHWWLQYLWWMRVMAGKTGRNSSSGEFFVSTNRPKPHSSAWFDTLKRLTTTYWVHPQPSITPRIIKIQIPNFQFKTFKNTFKP